MPRLARDPRSDALTRVAGGGDPRDAGAHLGQWAGHEGDVLVRVTLTSICGSDLHY
jgi:threonine dehydrogenase-like Zn-dependent dehydrogenase